MGKNKIIKSSIGNIRYDMNHFINLVRREDVLWNRNVTKFHNREQREVAWMQVARCLYKAFDKLQESEKREIVEVLMKRWKNARDSFLRTHRLKAGNNPYVPNYIYEQELQFLLADGRDASTTPVPEVAYAKQTSSRQRKAPRSKALDKSDPEWQTGTRKRAKPATATTTPAKRTSRKRAERASSIALYETISLHDDEDDDVDNVNGESDDDATMNGNDDCFDDGGDDVDDVVIVGNGINGRDNNDSPLLVPQIKMLLNTSTTPAPMPTTTTKTSSNNKKNGIVSTIIHTHTQSALEQLKDDVTSAASVDASTQQQNGDTMYEYVLPAPAPANALASDTDPDLAFFASIMPVVRAMDVSQKLDFQIEVLKLLKNFRAN